MNIPKPISYYQWKHPEEADPTGLFDGIMAPLVRRVGAQLIGLDLVPVQPLAAPRGVLFFPGDMIINDTHPKNIIERLAKPQPYSKWKRLKILQKKWEDSGVLEGLRGEELFEQGLIYAPYIPMMVTPTIVEGDVQPRAEIATRYAQRVVNNSCYGLLNINYHRD